MPPTVDVVELTVESVKSAAQDIGQWDEPAELVDSQNCCPSCRVRDLEDERRIAYVGMARARVSLGLRYAAE